MGTEIAKRYPIYITAFEKLVAEAQEQIEKARQCETAYQVCREALGEFGSNLDIELRLKPGRIDMQVTLGRKNVLGDFTRLASIINRRLIEAGLRSADKAPPGRGGMSFWCSWVWQLVRGDKPYCTIDVTAWLGLDGTADYAIEATERMISHTEYRIVPRSQDQTRRNEKPHDDEIPF